MGRTLPGRRGRGSLPALTGPRGRPGLLVSEVPCLEMKDGGCASESVVGLQASPGRPQTRPGSGVWEVARPSPSRAALPSCEWPFCCGKWREELCSVFPPSRLHSRDFSAVSLCPGKRGSREGGKECLSGRRVSPAGALLQGGCGAEWGAPARQEGSEPVYFGPLNVIYFKSHL